MPPAAKGGSQAPALRILIRRDIIRGKLPQGAKITEAALAERYGSSRVPVREALRVLAAEGFVESRPYAGSRVARLEPEEAGDLFAVRAVVEAATARRAAERAARQAASGTPDTAWWEARRRIGEIVAAGDAALAGGELQDLAELNAAFHLGVAELAGSASLQALLRQLAGKIEWLYTADVGVRGKESWPEHRRILAAVDAGNGSEAERLMSRHIDRSRESWLARFGAGT
ncbi:GntR family transcriptional regulator [Arthrobacter caoxuetaonis]|uniref:GntR family transcriptional regulator n=1 Tax=Arthrobacter caoxuetaonis TaxID=2886935 RepID=A0A9X1SBQ2_9MICC|nr:GntR family transcriptional regulator [Arthrobacter caoxuetaonis]MCC3297433.1 GntR family transcriptional regulator [Arthrobacter caoxuetaonis]USQ58035.1 GntR family transcriptional regulator [Arthrobacter caoxuetaonis]